MLTADFLRTEFDAALAYEDYVKTGTDEQQRRWRDFQKLITLTDAQRTLLGGFVRQMNVLCVSGIWCGDCVQQCPMFHVVAQANPERINLRFVDRDQHKSLSDQLTLNAGRRVPVVLFLAEDHAFCSLAGDRVLSRYRAIAARQLGAACPTGIVAPGADELADTLQDWVNEFERAQLMLRISPRLRQKHGD